MLEILEIKKYAKFLLAETKEKTMHFTSKKEKNSQHKYEISFNRTALFMTIFVLALVLQTQGYCDNAGEVEMNTMATNVVETIFAPWVRKTALALGGGLGIFQSIGAGSFKPFMTWGGIGLLINYIPKLVNFLSTLGA